MTQEQAMSIVKTGASVFLTGEPGSGKTHTVNRYVSYLRGYGIEPALTASTGIAATHIGGMTVHSWSGIGIKDALTTYDLERFATNERIVKRLTKAKVLVIDEVSMLDARTLDMVEEVCRAVRGNDAPFGGLQTVLVGDFFQLPPVARDGRIAAFAFRSRAWAELAPRVCYLTGQYRQDDAAFMSVLSAIRANAVDDDHFAALRDRVASHDSVPKDIVKLFSHNVDVDRINDRELARIAGVPKAFAMQASGPAHLVEALQRGCLSPENLCLKTGAAVMFTRNNPQMGFVNGTLGTVTGFDETTGYPTVLTRRGARITAEPMEWMIEDQGKSLAALRQVPLRLAWAMTIHKSQGMSLDAALVDLGSTFEYGQGYVALSRVRRLSGLHLLGCNERATQVHPDILAQDAVFRDMSVGAEERLANLSEEARLAAERAFVSACGGRASAIPEKKPAQQAAKDEHAKAYARWTPDEERDLTALFRSGTPVKEIAKRLDRQRGGITSRLKKLGLLAEEK
jgi:ATP-dependent DNA helicase PIF1